MAEAFWGICKGFRFPMLQEMHDKETKARTVPFS